jgi:peptidoglycan-associated lipoprotein
MNRTLTSSLGLLAAAALLGACASKVPVASNAGAATAPVSTATTTAPAASTAATTSATAQSNVAAVDLSRNAASSPMLADATLAPYLYFDFDSFAIRSEFKDEVEAHAQRLNADRSQRLVIRGHTDERGSREYNLALGQKRADAVARSLVLLGAQERQIETASYGEEKPKAIGETEEAMASNRRAELRPAR